MNAVLFDFGGTLDADGLTWKDRLHRLYRRAGLDVAADRFAPLFYEADDELVGAIPPTLSLRDTVHRLAAGVGRRLGVDEGISTRVADWFLDDARDSFARNAPLLATLSGRYRLGVVSNFYGNLDAVCDDAGIRPFLSVIVDSARIGYVKPDPRIFHSAVAALALTPADATFVGDSLARDMAGARSVGMRHIWLTGEASSGLAPCCPGDRVVRSLRAVEELLP